MPRVASPDAPRRHPVEPGSATANARLEASPVVQPGVRNEPAERMADVAVHAPAQSRSRPRSDAQASGRDTPRRLLIPIDATERSRWPLRYALAHGNGPLHVDLLFVAEPVTSLEVLRFRTQADVAEFQAKTAQWLLEDAAKPLQAAGLSVNSHFREGDVAEEIVETAERLGNDAIVMPPPHPVWINFLTRGIVRKVLRRARSTPVVHIDRDGKPRDISSRHLAEQST